MTAWILALRKSTLSHNATSTTLHGGDDVLVQYLFSVRQKLSFCLFTLRVFSWTKTKAKCRDFCKHFTPNAGFFPICQDCMLRSWCPELCSICGQFAYPWTDVQPSLAFVAFASFIPLLRSSKSFEQWLSNSSHQPAFFKDDKTSKQNFYGFTNRGRGGSITNNCSLLNRSTSLPELCEKSLTKFFFPAFVCKCDLDLRSKIKSGKPVN